MSKPGWQLTPYRIKRDHSNRTGFYHVSVPEAGQTGVGFQVRMGAFVVGLSITRTAPKSWAK